MSPNPQFPADLVKFTEETFHGEFYFLCSGLCFHISPALDILMVDTRRILENKDIFQILIKN